jgi:hypothetical protein
LNWESRFISFHSFFNATSWIGHSTIEFYCHLYRQLKIQVWLYFWTIYTVPFISKYSFTCAHPLHCYYLTFLLQFAAKILESLSPLPPLLLISYLNEIGFFLHSSIEIYYTKVINGLYIIISKRQFFSGFNYLKSFVVFDSLLGHHHLVLDVLFGFFVVFLSWLCNFTFSIHSSSLIIPYPAF